MNPLISVIIPVYNVEAYLARCLDSVIGNTYRNLEIICVDDGSTDNSLEILRRYEASDPRIVVISQKNSGVSSARNAALDSMHGEFVSFLDSDDWLHPQAFELLAMAQLQSSADVVIGRHSSVREFHPQTQAPVVFSNEKCMEKSALDVFKNHHLGSYCWGRIIRAKSVGPLRFHEDFSYSEDTLFNLELNEQCPDLKYCVLDCPVYYYFIRDDSVTREIGIDKRMDFINYCVRRNKSGTRNPLFFVVAVCRLLRFIKVYRAIPDAVKTFSKGLRRYLPRIWFSRLFTLREKIRFSVRSFSPG